MTDFKFKLITTRWGSAAAVWRDVDGPKLSRIYTAGLSAAELRAKVYSQYPIAQEVKSDQGNPWLARLEAFLADFYAGENAVTCGPAGTFATWERHLDPAALTPFRRSVMRVIDALGPGHTMTYGQVAAQVRRPQAARAVGAVMRTNPWPVLVPCHRVVGASGRLTGFSAPGGVGTKRRMLEMEKALVD